MDLVWFVLLVCLQACLAVETKSTIQSVGDVEVQEDPLANAKASEIQTQRRTSGFRIGRGAHPNNIETSKLTSTYSFHLNHNGMTLRKPVKNVGQAKMKPKAVSVDSKWSNKNAKSETRQTKGKGTEESKGRGYQKMSFKGKKEPQQWKGMAKGKGGKGRYSTSSIRPFEDDLKRIYETSGKGKGKGNVSFGVQSFVIVDAWTNTPLTAIYNGDKIDVNELFATFGTQHIAFECVTYGHVTSVLFTSNFGETNLDNHLPWTLFGDISGNYFGISLYEAIGTWTLTCQPFPKVKGQGIPGRTAQVQFSLSNGQAPTPTSAPVMTPVMTPAPVPVSTQTPTAAPITSTSSPTPLGVTPMPVPPTSSPTESRTTIPTLSPAQEQTPTFTPTTNPTLSPVLEQAPTRTPSIAPTRSPVLELAPTTTPTSQPTSVPTNSPTDAPTGTPVGGSTNAPTPAPDATEFVYGLQPDCDVFDDTRMNLCLDISSESGEVEEWWPFLLQAKERWERIIVEDR